jgi:hypothetical protein
MHLITLSHTTSGILKLKEQRKHCPMMWRSSITMEMVTTNIRWEGAEAETVEMEDIGIKDSKGMDKDQEVDLKGIGDNETK